MLYMILKHFLNLIKFKKNYLKKFKFVEMTRFEREALKTRIVNYFINVANFDKNSAVKHFKV